MSTQNVLNNPLIQTRTPEEFRAAALARTHIVYLPLDPQEYGRTQQILTEALDLSSERKLDIRGVLGTKDFYAIKGQLTQAFAEEICRLALPHIELFSGPYTRVEILKNLTREEHDHVFDVLNINTGGPGTGAMTESGPAFAPEGSLVYIPRNIKHLSCQERSGEAPRITMGIYNPF